MTSPAARPPTLRRVVLLSGPSGSGKGEVAGRSGVPTVSLDDFFREGDDPSLPQRFGIPDWDDPVSWRSGDALAALTALAHDGTASLPTYSIAESRRTGTQRLDVQDAPLLLAEGVHAAELLVPLRASGLLAGAIVLDRPAALVFAFRLSRDLREQRKPMLTAVRRSVGLFGDQPDDLARWLRAGMRPMGLRRAVRQLRELSLLADAERHVRVRAASAEVLRITAVCFLREGPQSTELLCVRKRGTGSWMQVGGKLEPGENPEQAAIREVAEELGVALSGADLTLLGDFEAVAANEPGTVVRSTVFTTRAPLPEPLEVRAELADHQWIPVPEPRGNGRLAPLMVQHILPALRTQSPRAAGAP